MTRIISIENELAQTEASAKLVLTMVNDYLMFIYQRPSPQPPLSLALDPALHFTPWGFGSVYVSRFGYLLYDGLSPEVRDQSAALRAHAAVYDPPIASVGWGATSADVVVLTWVPAWSDQATTTTGTAASVFTKIGGYLPGFEENAGLRWRAKANLLRKINMMDSLAELEKFVDLSAKLIIQLVDALPENQRPAWYPAYKDLLTEFDSTALKGEIPSLADMAFMKAQIRTHVLAYYQERGLI